VTGIKPGIGTCIDKYKTWYITGPILDWVSRFRVEGFTGKRQILPQVISDYSSMFFHTSTDDMRALYIYPGCTLYTSTTLV
jgi:hypothetical protein